MELLPEDDNLELTTVWSFPERGDWATHKGDYRGNWAPQIPRNIIRRYSKEDEIVLDPFVGSGTTAVEAKLLGRRAIGIDINPEAINIARERVKFRLKNSIRPALFVGDARETSRYVKKVLLKNKKVDLICTHPPYANIIKYTDNESDLSQLSVTKFVNELPVIIDEFYKVLKEDGYCAILIGDTRKQKHMIPLGFQVMQKFLDRGFKLKETIIKEQHNCTTTRRWKNQSIKQNFLLIAHEYLFVFRKPK